MFSFLAALEQFVGEVGGLTALMYVFGMLFFFSLPVTIIIEIVNWIRRRRTARIQAVVEAEAKEVAVPSIPSIAKPKYCMECGVELNPLGETGKAMCPKCGRIYELPHRGG
jgi:predicted Zn-ribbon and HTH transcriptional regulator